MLKRVVSFLLCFLLSVPLIASAETSEAEAESQADVAAVNSAYSGPYVEVGSVTLPLADHMPGSFFTKNGAACTCHYTSVDCIANGSGCNCMRYYPTGNPETCEIDLMGVQCFGFSRLVFYKCFGFIDHAMNASLYYSVGSLSRSAVNEGSVKALLTQARPGAHVRLSKGHSVSILTMDEDFIVVYHGNAGGDGITSQPCIVSTRRFTWAEFATYAAAGIDYVNMPYNYPESSLVLTEKSVGYYRITSDDGLRLREEANTSSAIHAVIPFNTIVRVSEIDGFWGKTEYEGKTGWIFLEYTTFYSAIEIAPSGSIFRVDDKGYLRGSSWKMSLEEFSEHFDKHSLVVKSPSGKLLTAEDYVTTGASVSLIIDGEAADTATVCLAGDVNCNGRLDVGDYIMIRRAYFGTYTLSGAASVAADIDGSGKIESTDYTTLKRFFHTASQSLLEGF